MGNYNLGAATTGATMKLDLRIMLRYGQIKNGARLSGTIEWTYGGRVSFVSDCRENDKFLRLVYSVEKRNGKTIEMDYRITIDAVPSNLGKGEVLYFVCPKSYQRARVLYDAYGLGVFAHRDWYKDHLDRRILYNSQQTSKRWYANTRYFNLKSEIERLEEKAHAKYKKMYYRGKLTKDFRRLSELKRRMRRYNIQRCNAFSLIIKNTFS